MSALSPSWLVYSFCAVMLATSAYCVSRLVFARLWRRPMNNDVNVAHVAMGIGMGAMLVPRLNFLPKGVWEAIFAILALWFASRSALFVARRGLEGTEADPDHLHKHHVSHYLTHLVMSGAMLYMFAETNPATTSHTATSSTASMVGMAGATGGDGAGFTLLLVVVLLASAVWHTDSLPRFAVPAGASALVAGADVGEPGSVLASSRGTWLAPRLEMGCHILMCITMAYMLVLML